MAKYARKSAIVSATQWHAGDDHPAILKRWSHEHVEINHDLIVNDGDYIIDCGSMYAVATPEIFNSLFQEIEVK
jgi:hypothetical protein